MTTTNKEIIKSLNRSALISELIEKTKRCAYVWKEIAPGQYMVTSLPYDFYITKTDSSTTVLDVWKNAGFYRTYNSYTQPEIAELYDAVDEMVSNSTGYDKMVELTQALNLLRSCQPQIIAEQMSKGLYGSGSAAVTLLVPVSTFMLPATLTFGFTPFPWSGGVSDIDDSPGVPSHDGDSTYIRQEVSGALPTQWGYAFVGFNPINVGSVGPFKFKVRAAARREAELGVTMIVDVVVNASVVFTDNMTPSDTYSIYDSGVQTMPPTITSVDTVEVRLSMFTNTGNTLPRALRVSAVDLTIDGFNPV
jgi:hypothetical protein